MVANGDSSATCNTNIVTTVTACNTCNCYTAIRLRMWFRFKCFLGRELIPDIVQKPNIVGYPVG